MSGAVLEARGLTVRHGGVVALDGVDLTVAAGTVLGLVGPNGAGKTTLLDVLSGLTRPDAGSVLLDGAPVDRLAPHRRARAGLVRTFQDLQLFADLTVREHLVLAATSAGASSDLGALLAELGLEAHAEVRPDALAGGSRHRLALARALAAGPRALLLDEPSAGLDGSEADGLVAAVRRAAAHGAAVVLVDHDVALVRACSDVLQVLVAGRTLAVGPPPEVLARADVAATYLGVRG